MKHIILGGSFDPVHIGHLHLADLVSRAYPEARIIFLPSARAAHKEGGAFAGPRDRLRMLSLALKGSPWTVEDLEINRGGTSYTIETVRQMREKYSWTEVPGFIIGDDLLAGFSRWKQADVLAREVNLIVANRLASDTPGGSGGRDFPYPHVRLDNRILPISSSEIRRGFREDGAVRFLLPPEVYRYIRKKGLYGCQS